MPLTPSELKAVEALVNFQAQIEHRKARESTIDPGQEPEAVRWQKEYIRSLLNNNDHEISPRIKDLLRRTQNHQQRLAAGETLETVAEIKQALREPETKPAPELFKRDLNI